MSDVVMGVKSCDWAGDCSVDAAYSYWGSSNGPLPPGGTPLVCGAVTTDPWYTSSAETARSAGGSLFEDGNCDGSPTPSQQLSSAEQSASAWESQQEIDCSQLGESTCQVIQEYTSCLSAATSLAGQTYDFPLSSPSDAAGEVGSALEESESATISRVGEALDYGTEIIGAGLAIYRIAEAYLSCE